MIYQSNSKHTIGGEGNRINAGIEPKNSLVLFERSIQSGKKRYSIDNEGNIHQFNNTNNGTWHWAGRSGSDQDKQQRLSKSDIPNDVLKHFDIPRKEEFK